MNLESRVRNLIEKKRVIITSAQYNARVNKEFLASLETYARRNDAEILILPMRGRSIADDELSEILAKYKTISRDLKLNNKIRISDYQILPQQIDPITGLARFTQSDVSTIFAATKIRLKVIPNSNSKLPKVLMTTGAVTHPNYRSNRIGKIAMKDHTYGAVLVEIESPTSYHFRHLTSLKNGVFYDLGTKYNGGSKPKFVRPEVMVLGDWHTGDTNPIVRAETFRMIEKYKPKNIILHDIFNGKSINHYNQNKAITLARNYKELSLEGELRAVAREIKYFCNKIGKNTKLYISKSNHDEWLMRYLQESRFMQDPQNTLIGAELLVEAINGHDPLREGIAKFYNIPSNVIFLTRDDDLKIRGWQLANHGDLGASGARGSVRSHEYASGKSIICHCFSEDTDILTLNGWKNGLELSSEDVVATMNKETRKLEWQKINGLFVYNNFKEMFQIKSRSCNLLVTGGHGLIAEKRNGELAEFTAEEFSRIHTEHKFFNAIRNDYKIPTYTDEFLRMIVWIVTDGFFQSGKYLGWHLKKERKIKRLTDLLVSLNINYKKGKKDKGGSIRISVDVQTSKLWLNWIGGIKELPEWFSNLDREKAETVFKEYCHTDGCIQRNSYVIYSSKKREIDTLQALAVINGFRTSVLKRKHGCFNLNITDRPQVRMSKKHVKKVSYNGKVWCVSVDNGTLLVRRKGKVVVTQNSHTPQIFRNVYIGGTSTHLKLDYNKGYSSWINCHVFLYSNGRPQLVNIINGKHKL